MKRAGIFLSKAFFVTLIATPASATTYFSQGSVTPNTLTNWNTVRAGGGTSPANFASGDTFVIQDTHAMGTTAAWTVSGTGATIQIESGGTLTANDLVAAPNFQVNNGGIYVHNANGSSANGSANDVPGSTSRTFGASSTVEFQKWANGGTGPAGLPNVPWGNLKINVATLNGAWNQQGALQTVNGNLIIQTTGGMMRAFRLVASVPANLTITIGGDLQISGGIFELENGSSNVTLNLGGNFSQTGGTFTSTGSAFPAFTFTGGTPSASFTQSAGTFTSTLINFIVVLGKTLTLNNDLPIANSRSLTVNGVLSCGTNLVKNVPSNTGTFTLNSGGTLGIGSLAGITTSGSTGNIQTTTRNFNIAANYTYDGSAGAQVTGNGLPAIVNDLTISNSMGVSLSGSVAVSGTLALTSGDLTTTDSFILTENGTSSGTGDVIGTVQRSDVGAGPVAFGNPNVQITNAGAMTLQVLLVKSAPGSFASAVTRVYSLNIVAGSVSSATIRLHYLDAELNSNDPSLLHLWRATGSPAAAWTDQGAPNSTQTASDPNNWIQNTGVTGFSVWTFAGGPAAPTAVKLTKFNASNFTDGVTLNWESGFEVNNLGYHLYRERNGVRTRVTPAVVAGSALKVGPRSKLTAGYSYSWLDRQGTPDTGYYLESIDLNGERELTGPIYPARAEGESPTASKQRATLLSDVASTTAPAAEFEQSWPASMEANAVAPAEKKASSKQPSAPAPAPAALTTQQTIAGGRAVKISVARNGWYRVTQPELVAAGLDANSDPRRLQLLVDGKEIPIMINGGDGQLRAGDSIEFYGQALDTLNTDTHVYWLISGNTSGKRLNRPKSSTVKPGNTDWANGFGGSFALTTERKDKMVYFAGLLNGEGENIFGLPVTSSPASQILTVRNLDSATTQAQLAVALQGVTDVNHEVQVQLNGSPVGTINFNGRQHPSQSFSVNRSLLLDGDNTVTLSAVGGDADVSLIDSTSLSYAHTYRADNNALRFSVAGGQTVVVRGFNSSAIRVIDITNPATPDEVATTIGPLDGGYAFKLQASGTTARTYMAFTDSQASQAAAIAANQPSSLTTAQTADMLIVTHKDFRAAIEPLAAQRRAEGLAVTIVDIEDVYDEFSFGAHTPYALRDFLSWTVSHWTRAPRYLLLAGDSSWDPRNYLDQGFGDFVPTKLIDTGYMETASDDWLADFDGDGVADIAIGRLPGRTATEVNRMVSKLLTYEQERQTGTPPRGALMVADAGFESESQATAALLPSPIAVQSINRADVGSDDLTRSQIVNGINNGPLIVNYFGHGSVTVWTGAGLLDSDLAANLTNNNRQSFFIMMTCLNGYSHDAYIDSLAEALLKAPNGGAMAVWASSGFTESDPQFAMSTQFYRQLFSSPNMRVGDAFKPAKAVISDPDVRRTWMLFGDPSMRIR
jgi:hypothetical protein